MKQLLLSITVLAAGLASCSRSDIFGGASVSGETTVAVSASLPADLNGTRSETGAEINRCQMEIYLDGVLCGSRQVAEVSGNVAKFEARLVSGKTYDFVFWADAAQGSTVDDFADSHYDTSDLSNVVIKDADAYSGNDETRDAFFQTRSIEITGATAVGAELRRPFGQLNVKTLDMEEVLAANIAELVPTHVSIAFKSVPMGINLLTGELLTSTDAVSYSEKCTVIDEEGALSMDYIFAPQGEGQQYLADFTMSFLNADGGEVVADRSFASIPVQRNYRTNVSGNFLTKKADINVDVVPDFEDEDIDHEIKEVSTIADANAAFAAGEKVVSVTEAPTEDAELILPKSTDGVTVALPALSNKLTVRYADDATATEQPATLNLSTPSAENLEIVTPNTTVTLNGAEYNKVSSSTADNTLIVGADVTIAELTIVKGNVEVYGSIGKVVKKSNNAKVILHAGDADKLVAYRDGVAAADANFFKSVNEVVLDGDIDFAGAEFKIASLSNVSFDGRGHKISNFKVENVQRAGFVCDAISVQFHNITLKNANVKSVNDGGGNAYAGAFIGRSYGKIVFDNCTVDGAEVEGVNKVGGMIGFVAENYVEANDCKVVNSTVSVENVAGESGQVGGFAGYIGSQYNSTCLFENCSVENTTIDVYMGEFADKRAFGKFIGCMQGSNATDVLTITGCKAENVTLNRLDENAQKFLSVYGDMLGGMRAANGTVNITDCDTDIKIETAGQFFRFAEILNDMVATKTYHKKFAGKTVKLVADIDLSAKEWTPIFYAWPNPEAGVLTGTVLDGNGHTVSNMHLTRTDSSTGAALGLFGNSVYKDMTVKNITFDNAAVVDKTTGNSYAGVIIGQNYVSVTLDNIKVANSAVVNQWQCGGLCGYAEGYAPSFVNCSIADSFVGGYNSSAAAIFGMGRVNVSGQGCSATNVKLYTDGLTYNSTQKQLGNFFVCQLYGNSLDAPDYVETNVTVVDEYPEEYR